MNTIALKKLYEKTIFLQSANSCLADKNPFIDIIGAINVERENVDISGIRQYRDFSLNGQGLKLLLFAIKKNPCVDIACQIATILLYTEYCELEYQEKQNRAVNKSDVERLTDLCIRLKKRIENTGKSNEKTKKLEEKFKSISTFSDIANALQDQNTEMFQRLFDLPQSETELKHSLVELTKNLNINSENAFTQIDKLLKTEEYLYNEAIGDAQVHDKQSGGFLNFCKSVIINLLKFVIAAVVVMALVAILLVIAVAAAIALPAMWLENKLVFVIVVAAAIVSPVIWLKNKLDPESESTVTLANNPSLVLEYGVDIEEWGHLQGSVQVI